MRSSGWRRNLSARDWAWFWSRVTIDSDARCWEWHGAKNIGGYGRYAGWLAHHLSLVWFDRSLPSEGTEVLHSCDNPACVNPNHLAIGTRKDNQQDSARKGRTARGERSGRAKLTAEQVAVIRSDRATPIATLAERYGVHKSTISYVKRGRSWKYAT